MPAGRWMPVADQRDRVWGVFAGPNNKASNFGTMAGQRPMRNRNPVKSPVLTGLDEKQLNEFYKKEKK